MKVRELVARLMEMDHDKEVVIQNDRGCCHPVSSLGEVDNARVYRDRRIVIDDVMVIRD